MSEEFGSRAEEYIKVMRFAVINQVQKILTTDVDSLS